MDRLEVIGEIPHELRGMFVRNGPNPQFVPKGNYHWFDGDGMLHGVRIEAGQASYRNRYVRTEGWQKERAAGKALYGGLADPIDVDLVLSGNTPFKNAANTALVWHDGRLLALWEGGEPYEVDAPDLETVGPYTFGGKLRQPFTAHPKVDPRSGEMMFFGYSPLAPIIKYSVANANGELLSTETVRLRRPVMMHDFAVTENYSIFMDLPVVFGGMAPAQGKAAAPTVGMTFDRELGARFGILPRHSKGNEVRWFDAESCFVFHTLGAFETGQQVHLVACRMTDYPDAVQIGMAPQNASGNPFAAGPQATLYEWTFDLATGRTSERALDERPVDFPRMDPRRMGLPVRYGYCLRLDMGAFVKYDLQSGSSTVHELGPGRRGGEGVFVPRPGGQSEDEGWLVTYLYDEMERRSEMVVIDAASFSTPPLARLVIPARIPHGFHGLWLDGALLDA
jgi:carotenoid cleavage dioxygenase